MNMIKQILMLLATLGCVAAGAKTQITPPVLSSKEYTGTKQQADVPSSEFWTVVPEVGNPGWTDAGTYSVLLLLTDADAYEWASATGVDIDEDLATVPFAITQAANVWTTTPSMAGWKWGETASTPIADAKFGTPQVVYNGTTASGTAVSGASSITAAGSYTAVFSVPATANYTALSASVDFTVSVGEISGGGGGGVGGVVLAASGFEGSYDGADHSISVSVSSEAGETFSITYCEEEDGTFMAVNPSYRNVGTYTVWYKISSSSYADFKSSLTVKINKASVDAPVLASKAYTGSVQTADVPSSTLYETVMNLGGTSAGTYQVFVQLTDGANYAWAAAPGVVIDEDVATLSFAITQAANEWTTAPAMADWKWGELASTPVAVAKFGTPKVVYNGTKADGTSVSGATSVTAPGSYTAFFSVDETTDFAGLETGVAFNVTLGSINIDPSSPTEPKLIVQGYSGVYDGNFHSITVQIQGAGSELFTITYGRAEAGPYGADNPQFKDAGTETVWYAITSPNFAPLTNSANVVISKAGVASPVILGKVFNGAAQTATIPASSLYDVVRNNGGKMAGTYAVVLSLTDSANYRWNDCADADIVLPFEITRAENAWTEGPVAPTGVLGTSAAFPVAASKYGDVEVRYSGTAVDGTVVANALQVTRPGNYMAKFAVKETSSWSGQTKEVAMTVSETGDVTVSEPKTKASAMVCLSAPRALSIPRTWFSQYAGFSEKYGDDLVTAATKTTGKLDGNGTPMQVWQDYVAGTDPTDEDSKLEVRIEVGADGRPSISWTPNKNAEGVKVGERVYTIWGKESLTDTEWTANADELPGDWKFFKVTVDMPE